MIYAPNRDELSRQGFVLGLKLLANGVAQQRVRDVYRNDLLPRLAREEQSVPENFRAIAEPLARTPEFRTWALLTHASQSMMWEAIELTAARVRDEAQERFAQIGQRATRGSLELDPSLPIPAPIADTEIHRQPGGYVGARDRADLLPGLRYIGASYIYGVGKGQRHASGDGRARLLLDQLKERAPADFRPRRILDLGCGIGLHSQAIAAAFPEAEYHAIDVAPGLLRFAHLLAEERGVPIHFHQRDAAESGFADGEFDLVLSNIFFHETNSSHLPRILRECRRVLSEDGVMLHVDVATQHSRLELDDQLMNDWQVLWNGEPFWTGFAEIDMQRELLDAGFDPDRIFVEHSDRPGGATFVFGVA